MVTLIKSNIYYPPKREAVGNEPISKSPIVHSDVEIVKDEFLYLFGVRGGNI